MVVGIHPKPGQVKTFYLDYSSWEDKGNSWVEPNTDLSVVWELNVLVPDLYIPISGLVLSLLAQGIFVCLFLLFKLFLKPQEWSCFLFCFVFKWIPFLTSQFLFWLISACSCILSLPVLFVFHMLDSSSKAYISAPDTLSSMNAACSLAFSKCKAWLNISQGC